MDEARLSSNRYSFISYERSDINKIKDNDAHLLEVPIVSEGYDPDEDT